ncbi:MAG TPA: deoxyribose-phosphate aldolase [Acidimicrobiales bacterium]|nr:deoxyribose-phosphate aldolase [Acidimicrobiales bacterium]
MLDRRTARLRDIRVHEPQAIAEAARRRRRRPIVGADGKIFIVAADHPARGSLGVGPEPMAMADREDLLERLCIALGRPCVDGVLATPDIVEDLLLLGVLEDKVVIGSMNRGGLVGSAFELDDRFTAYDVETIAAMGLDGGKMLCRIAPEDPATAPVLEACGRAITALAAHRMMAMVEPFWARRSGDRIWNDLSSEKVIHSVAITAALGATSAYTWLKLPVVADMARVVAATTLPVVVLGGDPSTREGDTLEALAKALALDGVRGLAAGRALLYPEDDDVAAAIDRMGAALGRG